MISGLDAQFRHYAGGWAHVQGMWARRQRLARTLLSRTERGRISGVSVPALRRQAAALGGDLRIESLLPVGASWTG